VTVTKGRYIHLWGQYKGGEWEWIDTADESNSKSFLYANYRDAFGEGWKFCWRKSR